MGWQKGVPIEEIEDTAGPNNNIGILLGSLSGGVVDVDLDCPEAIAIAPIVLPQTVTFGREYEEAVALPLPHRGADEDGAVPESGGGHARRTPERRRADDGAAVDPPQRTTRSMGRHRQGPRDLAR